MALNPVAYIENRTVLEIRLEPVNREFEPIVLTTDDETAIDVVAELLQVIGTD